MNMLICASLAHFLWLLLILLSTTDNRRHCNGNKISPPLLPIPSSSILVVGATGTTGLRAIQGLLDVGYKPSQLHIMTRSNVASKRTNIQQLKKLGFHLVEADMQHPSSLHNINIGKGCKGCYIHATGGDTKELDTTEVSSAQNLIDALHNSDVTCIVYNSAAAESQDHTVGRIQQKHDVETILSKRKKIPCHVTCLRANLFGEELWKEYTRPEILLKGRYPLPVNRWKKIYLTSVKDMGRLAGTIIARDTTRQSNEHNTNTNTTNTFRILNVAGDRLSGPQIAKVFGKAQRETVKYYNNRELTKMAKESIPDLYEQIHFLQTDKEKTNIRSLKEEFPGLITSFPEFVEETKWSDRERKFEDLSNPEELQL